MLLDQAREEINYIDREIAALFERRMKVAEKIVVYKIANDIPILDAAREAQVIKQNCELIKDKALVDFYSEFITSMMAISRKYQESILDKSQ